MAPTKESTLTAKVVDFTNVKDGGGAFNKRRIRAGDYLTKIVKVQDAEAKGDGTFQYLFTLSPVKFGHNTYPYYCKLAENQLWKLRNLFISAGINVPKKRMRVDPSKLVGKLVGATFDDAEYEGKSQSEIVSVFPASELGDEETDDSGDDSDEGYDEPEEVAGDYDMDEDVQDDDAEEEPEEDEADQFDSMDRTQLKAFLKAQDEGFVAKKSQSDDDLRDLARAAGGDEEDAEEEEEPEPEPAPRRTAKKTAAKKATPARRKQTEDEELEELDLDEL